MPVEIKYIDGGDGIELIGKGVVTGEEIYKANHTIYSGDILIKQKYRLIDLVNIEGFDATHDDTVRLADQDIKASRANPNIRIAVVADDDLAFGLARLWEGYVSESGLETMVFRDKGEARKWLYKKIDRRY